eukprot:1157732-Pelagomonas_calceolata.AAC.8
MGCAASTQAAGQQPFKVATGGDAAAPPSAVKALDVQAETEVNNLDVQAAVQAPGGGLQEAHEPVEASIDAAAQIREKWMSEMLEEGWEDVSGDVDIVLEGVEKLVGLFQSVGGKGKQEDPVDLQSLALCKRSKLEQGFAKYSALGQVGLVGHQGTGSAMGAMRSMFACKARPCSAYVVLLLACASQVLIQVAGPAMEAMPFGAPAAAILGAVYARAAQVRFQLLRSVTECMQVQPLVAATLRTVFARAVQGAF